MDYSLKVTNPRQSSDGSDGNPVSAEVDVEIEVGDALYRGRVCLEADEVDVPSVHHHRYGAALKAQTYKEKREAAGQHGLNIERIVDRIIEHVRVRARVDRDFGRDEARKRVALKAALEIRDACPLATKCLSVSAEPEGLRIGGRLDPEAAKAVFAALEAVLVKRRQEKEQVERLKEAQDGRA